MTIFAFAFFLAASLTPEQAMVIGVKVWQNECGGTLEGITAWNQGEEFASLGIGHFIWYPHHKNGPFEETFPRLLQFLKENGIEIPRWLEDSLGCPWKTRDEFQRALRIQSKQIVELRRLLQKTIALQTQFLSLRLEKALPQLLAQCPEEKRAKIQASFDQIQKQHNGSYVLLDYVNFKGYGTSPKEQYNGSGWGLFQVLDRMQENSDPIAEFVKAAKGILEERVQNSPVERNENRFLLGWLNRLDSYLKPLPCRQVSEKASEISTSPSNPSHSVAPRLEHRGPKAPFEK
jgi:hypothetical protein